MGESAHRGGNASAVVGTFVAVGSGAQVLANQNLSRNALRLFNNGTAACYLGYGVSAVASQSFPLLPSSMYVEPDFVGTVSAVSPGGTVLIYVTDI